MAELEMTVTLPKKTMLYASLILMAYEVENTVRPK